MGPGDDSRARIPRTLRLPGVYPPQEDTALLIEALSRLEIRAETAVLDVCTGSGAVALAAADGGSCDVTAVDISRRAVWTTRWNARLRGRRGVRAYRADVTDLGRTAMRCTGTRGAGQRFDVIVCNPPYVPAPPGTDTRGADRAWDAGARGRALLDPLCRLLPTLLNPGGRLLIVQSECADIPRSLDRLGAHCASVRVLARRSIAFGPVMTSRSGYLEREGLLPAARREEIAVIEAVGREAHERPRHRSPAGAVAVTEPARR